MLLLEKGMLSTPIGHRTMGTHARRIGLEISSDMMNNFSRFGINVKGKETFTML